MVHGYDGLNLDSSGSSKRVKQHHDVDADHAGNRFLDSSMGHDDVGQRSMLLDYKADLRSSPASWNLGKRARLQTSNNICSSNKSDSSSSSSDSGGQDNDEAGGDYGD